MVELFTAQGCPACPAADDALARLAARRDVIALSFPVALWDARGWPDPLAQPAFADRQQRYAASGRRATATPQFVVNGRFATSATDAESLAEAIAVAARVRGPSIGANGRWLTVGADARMGRDATVWLVEYNPRPIRTPIRAGETRGRTAVQVHVVRWLASLGRWSGAAGRYRLPPPRPGLRRAALVQGEDGGAIVAAAVIG